MPSPKRCSKNKPQQQLRVSRRLRQQQQQQPHQDGQSVGTAFGDASAGDEGPVSLDVVVVGGAGIVGRGSHRLDAAVDGFANVAVVPRGPEVLAAAAAESCHQLGGTLGSASAAAAAQSSPAAAATLGGGTAKLVERSEAAVVVAGSAAAIPTAAAAAAARAAVVVGAPSATLERGALVDAAAAAAERALAGESARLEGGAVVAPATAAAAAGGSRQLDGTAGRHLERQAAGGQSVGGAAAAAGLRQISPVTATFQGRDIVWLKNSESMRDGTYVSQSLLQEFQQPTYSDVILQCSDGKVRSHKIVLASLSPMISEALRGVASDEEALVILPDVTENEIRSFLEKAYGGGPDAVHIGEKITHLGFALPKVAVCNKRETWVNDNDEPVDFERKTLGRNLKAQRLQRPSLGKYSLIWYYFREIDKEVAECLACSVRMSTKGGKTSGMIQHLRRKHHDDFEQLSLAKETGTLPQPEPEVVVDIILPDYDVEYEEYDPDFEEYEEDLLPEASVKSTKKRSPIWRFFSNVGTNKVMCLECDQIITQKMGTTSGMFRHLRRVHPLCSESLKMEPQATNTSGIESQPEPPAHSVEDEKCGEVIKTENSSSNNKRRSLVWNYFEEVSNTKVQCLHCPKSVSRCSEAKSTSGMFRHLRRHHPDIAYLLSTEKEAHSGSATSLKTITEESEDEQQFVADQMMEEEVVEQEENLTDQSLQPAQIDVKRGGDGEEGRRSAIWSFFQFNEDLTSRTCLLCATSISGKQQNTSNMIRHLHRQHPEEYDKFLQVSGYEKKEKVPKPPRKMREPKGDPEDKTCPECIKTYSSRKAMLYHMKVVHSGIRAFTCEECGATFSRQTSFANHTHCTDRPFLCSVCGKTFRTKNAQDRHERGHFGVKIKRHQCDFCDRCFHTTQQKKNHELVHTGVKPFQCGVCQKQFARQHQLMSHRRIHTGEKPYECQKCGVTFRHLSSRNNHKCGTLGGANSVGFEQAHMVGRSRKTVTGRKGKSRKWAVALRETPEESSDYSD